MIPTWLKPHTVTVEPYLGTGAYGPTYGPPVPVPCYLEQRSRLVRAADGGEVISISTVYCDPGVTIPAGSLVTVSVAGVTAVTTVITVSAFVTGGALDHLEVSLGHDPN